jgi:dTDP-4-dehydrorhamnose 3,5-epimerase
VTETPPDAKPALPSFEPLGIEGAWLFTPRVFGDARGSFAEWFRGAQFEETVGHPLRVAQSNISISAAGVVRGIHLATTPPGQAKYVTCMRGRVLDLVVDVRVGSPTYGRHEFVELTEENQRAVYVSEGLGHGFIALTDDSAFVYLVSEPFNPTGEFGIHPFDPELAIAWPDDIEVSLSAKDEQAPTLAEARAQGLLPDYEVCRRFRDGLATG